MLRRIAIRAGLAILAGGATAATAEAQPFDPGPPGTVVGSSMSGARIGGHRSVAPPVAVPGARVFGDTVEERAYGRDYDDSYLRPRIPVPDADGAETRLRAGEGRSVLGPDRAGDFVRSDPSVMNRSGVSRLNSPGGRARIVPNRRPAR